MKTTISTIALCLGFTILNAQEVKEAEVPAPVKNTFSKKYAGAKVEKWEKEDAGYEAEFKLNKVESSALFAEDGSFKEVEQEIKISELPKGVAEYCTKSFVGYKLSEASKITDAAGKVMFEAEMTKGKEHFDAIFDSKGAFSKKTEPSSKEEDKD
ncbi:MAG: PepSY-like domain-containing protein [Burkholderiales bacterium]|nr:PepSY-like domain-containing protein [Bacteroidia bacterium]